MRIPSGQALLSLSLLLGCSEPILYVGKAPRTDATVPDVDAAITADAGAQPESEDDDGGDDDDDDEVRCDASVDCAERKEAPYCHAERLRCVECLEDGHCDSDERCDSARGDCEER